MRERAQLRRDQHHNEVRRTSAVCRKAEEAYKDAMAARNSALREAHGTPHEGKLTYQELVADSGLSKGALRKIIGFQR